MKERQARLAVLIDADNTRPNSIEPLLEEIANYGTASVKRIYGDWTSTQLKGWKPHLLDHGIQPIQQFSYTTGKNATDSALIIDAMDLLYTEKFDGFCIVSSDSDFTRLASRIRESGLTVYGFGETKTPGAFTSACDQFIFIENLLKQDEPKKDKRAGAVTLDEKTLNRIRNAVDNVADDAGWSAVGSVKQNLSNKYSDFDPRSYGFRKLSDLLESCGEYEFKSYDPLSNSNRAYVRYKRKKKGYGA